MATTKYAVRWNGKIIGTRGSNRTYTHALVLVDFDPEVVRQREERYWANSSKDLQNSHRYAIESFKNPSPLSTAEDKERHAKIAAMSFEEYVGLRRLEHEARVKRLIDHGISKGAQVLSFAGSRELAFKAQAQARKNHPEYLVLVEPVEVVSKKA